VESEKVAFAPPGEEQVRRRCENTAVEDINHLEFPLPLAGEWIESFHRAGPVFGQPPIDWRAWLEDPHRHRRERTGEPLTLLEFNGPLGKCRIGIHPARNVEEAGARTVRG